MNADTKIKYNLALMYEYINNILEICAEYNNDYEKVLSEKKNKLAINMCIVEIGEHCTRIRDIDEKYYEQNEKFKLFQIKGMRDRIVHSYGKIDYNVVKEVISVGVPKLKKDIESEVDKDILKDPYVLYEIEYADYVKNKV